MPVEQLVRWDTFCSDSPRLYFVSLIDNLQGGKLVFTVTDGEANYEYSIEHLHLGPYQIFDEAFSNYQAVEPSPGRSYVVSHSNWHFQFSAGLDFVFPNGLTHYGICADDSCLEILATSAPTVKIQAVNSPATTA